MKKLILFLGFAALLGASVSLKAQVVKLSFNYKVLNTVEGYAHVSKLVVYVDDTQAGESEPLIQTKPGTCTVYVAPGNHKIRAVLMARYDGIWEERTIANNYSQDFVWNYQGYVRKPKNVKLTFDIDKGTSAKGL